MSMRIENWKMTVVVLGLLLAGGSQSVWTEEAPEEKSLPPVLSLGDVEFPHRQHIEDFELECRRCHHETEAAVLEVPHPEYFEDLWERCQRCHRTAAETLPAQSCSNCHSPNPADIADEILSAKVVIHRSCWDCHAVGRGAEASQGCGTCHRRERRSAPATTAGEEGAEPKPPRSE